MLQFRAAIDIIGVNPFVFVPDEILSENFRQAGKDKGAIPIHGTINGNAYKQTLVKFRGEWRLYINTKMLKRSPERVGETIDITLMFDPSDRTIHPHEKFVNALELNDTAKTIFDSLRPSLKHEIARYIASLKSEESIDRNVEKAIAFLLGNGRFVGRDKP